MIQLCQPGAPVVCCVSHQRVSRSRQVSLTTPAESMQPGTLVALACVLEIPSGRFAIPNYGTTDMDIDIELWFSTDDQLDRTSGADKQSPTVLATTVSAGGERPT